MLNNKEPHAKENIDNVFNISLPGIPFEIILDNDFLLDNRSMDGTKHTHPVYDVHFASKGDFKISFDSYDITIKESNLIVINTDIYHGMQSVTDDAVTKSFEFAISKSESSNSDKTIKKLINSCFSYNKDYYMFKVPSFRNLFHDIVAEHNKQDCLSGCKIQSLLTNVMITIIRRITKESDRFTKQTINKTCDSKYLIDSYFRENCNNPNASRKKLASILHITPRHLDRVIKRLYNCTFSQKLMSDRMENSKSLLECTNVSIEYIVRSVGLSSPEYFYKCFKKYTGLTPGQYRTIQS